MSSASSASLFEADESRQDMYSGEKPSNATNKFSLDTNTKIAFINAASTIAGGKVIKKKVLRILTPEQLEFR